ncbi:MAG: SDR family NAD(P)-dependent oxidoreductase, partial [bacterium]|nr:SDR family NAD(P)-dependent oxidoreductase [bacterium]
MGSLEEEKKNNSGGSPEVDHSVRDIAIIGIACRFPEADDYNQYWDNLIQGKNSIKEIPPDRWDTDTYYSPNIEEPNKSVSKWCGLIDNIDRFDNRFFNISPREAKNMDPQQRLLMEETWHCIEDAGVPLETLSEKSTAVYIGVMADDYLQEASSPNVIIDSYAGLGNYDCILANRISYFFNFTGASMAVHAACASSLVAMHEARRSLIMKECHYALAGGVSLNFFPWKYISFSKSRMLSPDGQCKTFDKDANGYVPGEGIGVVLLQPLVDAVAAGNHVYGVIKGSAVNHGGKTLSITAPRVESQRDLILTAYADAGFSPATVSYAEAHGTGTSLGDPIEIEAQTLAFREFTDEKEFCKIGSVKTNIGHLEASAGVAGVVKVLMMMRHKKIPKSLNVSVVNPIINFMETPFSVALEDAGDWVSRSDDIPLRASVSSFGFGGVNSFTLLEEFPENSRDSIINNLKLKDPTMILPGDIGDEPDYFFLLSARSSSSLENMISRWKDFSQSDSFTRSSLPDTCATLIRGRGHFPFRFGVRLSKKENLFDALNNAEIFSPESGNRPWCFRVGDFFWSNPGFMKTLRDESPLFRVNLEKIESRLSALDAPADMLHSLYSSDWPEPSRQLFSFMAAFAFVMTLLELGFSPDVMTGEKHGVLVALVAVDIMRLDDALVVLLNRKELKDILFTRPSIPYYDPVLKKTAMPFHFDQEYLRLLVDELSRQSKLLGQILVDGIFVTQDKSKDDSVDRLAQTQLGILLLHDGAVTQEQLDNALAAQKESGDLLGHILVEKRFCSSADLAEALREQDVLRYYVVDVLSHYVDKARLLNTSQFTFRKFLDEWDAILKNSNTDISSLLYDDQLLVQEGGRLRKEKLLLMVVIMTSLRKLNQKWNLTELHLVEDKRFYELVNLVADNIMPKEALVDLLLSDNPDFKGIAHSLNKRQINRNLNNDYRFIERTNPNIREIDDVSAWLSQAMEIENVTGEQMAYYPVEDMSFLEFGVFSDSSGFSNSRVCCNMGDSLFDLYKDSLLSLWHMGVNFQWELLFPEGCFRKAALPVYAFEGKAFWLSGKEGIHERVEAPVVRKAVPVSKLKQSDEKGMVYSRTFTPEDRIIQDHVITGKGIIPGAGMIEMGCEGAQRATGQPVTLLKNVVVLNPGIVGSGLAVDVEVDPGEKQFFVKSKDGNLCKGDFDSAEPDKIASFDFSDYRNKQPEDISGLYKALSRIGYEYGDGLQVIKNVRKFDKGYIFELQESSKEEGLFSNISPNLLDGIFQLPFTEKYLRGEFSENEGLFIPYMISSLTIFDVLQDRCFIVLNNEDLERKGNDLFVQLHVYNHLGKPVLDIRNMVFKKVPNDFLTQFMQPDLASGLAREEIKKVFYYQPAWIQRPIQKIGKLEAKEKLSGRTAIVFLDKDGLSDSLSKEIDGLYLRIFYIIQGSGFLQKENNTFEIDSSNNKDYKDCISRIFSDDAVSAGNCDIYHLWSYEPEVPVINNGNDLLTRQENGVRSLFFLAQALTGVRLSEKVNIIMGTCDCYSVEPNNKGNGYYTGGISGLAKTVMMENPKIKIKIVDFAANTGTVLEKSQLIFDEAISFDSEELVAYRTNGRCVRVIEEAPPAGNDAASVWKENGVYLLIGGAGGIGIKIAEFISEHITCKLVILGRSELSKEKTKQFDALGSSGSDILYLRGDVTHKDQMIQTISTIKEKYGTLNGIIHAGGLLDDKLLMSKDWESFIRVLAPKVAGVWNIHEATKSEQLDFFVVFSSIVAVAGNIGQSDYAAANSFLDSFISYRSQNNFP